MSAVPVFNQVNSSVYVLSTLADTGLVNYWAGYFADPPGSLGTSASTSTVWQNIGGFYLFLDQIPSDWTKFAADLTALRPNLGPPDIVRCVWINNAGQSYLQWQITVAFAKATGTGVNISWQLMRSVAFNIGAYQLSLTGLSALTYITDENGGGIGFPGGVFNGPEGGYTFPTAQLSFSGTALGAFSSSMTIAAPSSKDQCDLWKALNIGLQYAAAPTPSDDEPVPPVNGDDPDPAAMAYATATKILFMPVFARQTATLNLGILFDPLLPLVASRTSFSLFPAGTTASPVQESFLRTTRGYTIQLTPLKTNGVLPDARFVFGYCPVQESLSEEGYRYHLSPDGAFQATILTPSQKKSKRSTTTPLPNQLLLGLSGLEYASLDGASYMIIFQGNKPAFIPYVPPSQSQAPDISKALTGAATTSHLTVMSLNNQVVNPVYYAQPREAPLFSGIDHRTDNILDFNPMPAFTFPYNVQQQPVVFPVGIYKGLSSDENALAREMENASLAPYRNYFISKQYGVTAHAANAENFPVPKRRLRSVNDPLGVTPQGLVAELTPDYKNFDGLIMGNMPGTNYPKVDFTAVEGMFKQALQNNQLFFVATNAGVLMSGTSVRYQLTEKDKPFLLAMGVTQAVIDAVYLAVSRATQPFDTEELFVNCIRTAAGNDLGSFLKVAGILKVEMDGWTFQLSPRTWRTDAESPTLLVAKFCNRSLRDLANDTSSWYWPEVATPQNGTLTQTQTVLLNICKAAAAPDAAKPLRIFYDTVLNDKNWNGFLFLNAPVDISEMPDDLKFLTAGIDLTKFCAHHIGFSQTPFNVLNGVPQLQQTAAFGLINYEDPMDLYAEQSIPFGFKTTRLRVRFANAALVDFSAEVELMLNSLLGSSLTKQIAARGNNLIIGGSYQRVGGAPCYAFALNGENIFNANDTVLTDIEVLSVQVVNGGITNSVNVLTNFILMGNFRFLRIEAFDLFSFGPGEDTDDRFLRYNGLGINMQFSLATPKQQTFTVKESNTAFDMVASHQRTSSLMNNFPLAISGLVASPNLAAEGEKPSGQTPEDMGYTSVAAPLEQTPMVPGWYGLVLTLDLGTFGALTGSVSFKISILAAWRKGDSQTNVPVYLGLKLPGIPVLGGSFPLQGVLKIGFRNFQFETYTTAQNELGYLLRLRRFSLSVLVWSFPPGNNNIILFGQPRNPKGSLGWYAAYSDDKDDTQAKTDPLLLENTTPLPDHVQRRLKSGRRTPPIG